MIRSTMALAISLAALASAKEIVTVSDSSRCDRLPRMYQDQCASRIRTEGAFSFRVLESRPDRLVIEPINPGASDKKETDFAEAYAGTLDPAARRGAEERKAEALEEIADATKRTSYAVSIIAGINVLFAIIGIIALTR